MGETGRQGERQGRGKGGGGRKERRENEGEGGREMGRERMNEGKYWVGFSDPEGQKSISCLPDCLNRLLSVWYLWLFSLKGSQELSSPPGNQASLAHSPTWKSPDSESRDQAPHRSHRKFLCHFPTCTSAIPQGQPAAMAHLGPGRSLELPQSTTVYSLCVFILGLSLLSLQQFLISSSSLWK